LGAGGAPPRKNAGTIQTLTFSRTILAEEREGLGLETRELQRD
jgi:hypothetical protein